MGALDAEGHRVMTKRALREMLAIDPAQVKFDCTGLRDEGRIIKGDSIPPGMTLVVVGPDPFTKRSWYANAYNRADGTLVVR
ncbi:hypothetical protein [Nakamurella sp. PAMC28650]|uniref:hypothetical protein n=1 Tax=Nakamurella sp. PAMC28650 TaxID=2762325 RepID=UPI00164DBE67|nr:hypothetical protein [Nakamurella sp. PAMC28650]QNK82611.1 hypothetical protein H7F38_07855 [Nakamurella sp. PAMC28650]